MRGLLTADTAALVVEAERGAQRFAGCLRLALGVVLLFVASKAQADELASGALPLAVVLAYFAIGVASLVVTHPRLFSTAWAPVFVVIDVLWYYTTLVVELLASGTPPNEFVTMPVFGVLAVLIALAGMRYTPWALLAGLATFALLDALFYTIVLQGLWPGAPPSDDPRFSLGVNVFRITAVAAMGLVVGLTSLRARQTLIRALRTGAERDAVQTLFGRYVPAEVAAEMVAEGGALPARSGIATILFCDIEGFSRLAEIREPATLVTMMNAYFRRVEGIIASHDGIVTHFQGDGVLATFNLPLARVDHADRALAAAAAIARAVADETFAGERLKVRVGIATGPVAAGIVGGVDRLAYTVYGDVVNVAARLQQVNKALGTVILCSGSTVDALVAPPALRPHGAQALAGRTAALEVFEPTIG